jgi:hypothetical protein
MFAPVPLQLFVEWCTWQCKVLGSSIRGNQAFVKTQARGKRIRRTVGECEDEIGLGAAQHLAEILDNRHDSELG